MIIEAALVYDNANREILDIDGYAFSYDVCKYLNAALSEDKNIAAMWIKDRLAMTHIFNEVEPDVYKRQLLIFCTSSWLCSFSHGSASSTVIPSIPGAPLFAFTLL